jgi:hypothetical protein
MEHKDYKNLFDDLQNQIEELHSLKDKIRDIDPNDAECKNISKRIWDLILRQAEVVKHL